MSKSSQNRSFQSQSSEFFQSQTRLNESQSLSRTIKVQNLNSIRRHVALFFNTRFRTPDSCVNQQYKNTLDQSLF